MSKEYKAKVFKSGNSVALRLPKALGLKDGDEMILREERSEYVFKPADKPRQTIDVSSFWGKLPGIELAPRADFEERPSTIAKREAQQKP